MVRADKFICFQCKHFRLIAGGCDAFPDGIPMSITDNGDPHDKPLPSQGNDIVFKRGKAIESITAEWKEELHPRDDIGRFTYSDGAEVTPADRELIYNLTKYNGDIADYLRGGKVVADEKLDQRIEQIDKFIAKSPKYNGDVYRTLTFGGRGEEGRANYEKFVSQVQPGAIFVDKSFMSTTKDKSVSDRVAPNWVKYAVQLHIKGNKGVAVEDLSKYGPSEKEVLYPRNTKLLIKDVKVVKNEHGSHGNNNIMIVNAEAL